MRNSATRINNLCGVSNLCRWQWPSTPQNDTSPMGREMSSRQLRNRSKSHIRVRGDFRRWDKFRMYNLTRWSDENASFKRSTIGSVLSSRSVWLVFFFRGTFPQNTSARQTLTPLAFALRAAMPSCTIFEDRRIISMRHSRFRKAARKYADRVDEGK